MKREWESFVTQKELNEVAVIAARISDNVLDEEDWPVHVLRFREDGVCIRQTVENEGAYIMHNFVDQNLHKLVEWSNYDLASSSEELSHELCILMYF
jgi:hypothetical protein